MTAPLQLQDAARAPANGTARTVPELGLRPSLRFSKRSLRIQERRLDWTCFGYHFREIPREGSWGHHSGPFRWSPQQDNRLRSRPRSMSSSLVNLQGLACELVLCPPLACQLAARLSGGHRGSPGVGGAWALPPPSLSSVPAPGEELRLRLVGPESRSSPPARRFQHVFQLEPQHHATPRGAAETGGRGGKDPGESGVGWAALGEEQASLQRDWERGLAGARLLSVDLGEETARFVLGKGLGFPACLCPGVERSLRICPRRQRRGRGIRVVSYFLVVGTDGIWGGGGVNHRSQIDIQLFSFSGNLITEKSWFPPHYPWHFACRIIGDDRPSLLDKPLSSP